MNDLPPLSSVTAFIQVAELGAFNEAARVLDLSPSATSKAVTRLEETLGVKLLNRTTRSVSLTPEGERYLEGAKKAMDDLAIVGQEVANTSSTPKGKLKVSAPSPFARLWLADALAGYTRHFPDVELELLLTDQLSDLAAEGIDIAIRSGGLAESAHLIAKKLYDEDLMVCASPEYWAKHTKPEHPNELVNHNCVGFRASQTGRLFPWTFTSSEKTFRVDTKGSFTVDEGEMNLNMVLQGMGVSQLPGYMARKHIHSGALEEVLIEFRPPPVQISAMYLDRRLLSPRIRSFIDYISKYARSIDV